MGRGSFRRGHRHRNRRNWQRILLAVLFYWSVSLAVRNGSLDERTITRWTSVPSPGPAGVYTLRPLGHATMKIIRIAERNLSCNALLSKSGDQSRVDYG